MSIRFADRVQLIQSSAIREILKVAESPEVISFAGGLPAPEFFPVMAIRTAYQKVLDEKVSSALQYSTTEGYLPLREYLADLMLKRGFRVAAHNILITNGSQQALDLLAKLFINPGDTVLVENPAYLAALQAFQSYQARLVAVPVDAGGMQVEVLEALIHRYQPKLIYVVPNFQNPTGITLAPERRKYLARIAARHGIHVVEDDPYGELIYEGESIPAVISFDGQEQVVYISTFSKTVAPGLRLGWVAGSAQIISKLVLLKQCADLQTSTIAQRVMHRYVFDNDVEQHINKLRLEYRRRRDAMLDHLQAWFPPETNWTSPHGGMFIWVTLAETVDTQSLLPVAVAHRVAFVPGTPFHSNGGGGNTMRLNFSNSTPDQIALGIERLGMLLQKSTRRPVPGTSHEAAMGLPNS